MKYQLELTVNGMARQDDVDPRLLLVQYLRDELGLTGAHVACDTSQCGACTVLVDGKAVKSCTMLAVQAEHAEITTIEGLAGRSELHPVQRAFWQEFGLQCGYCTPGFIMSTVYLLSQGLDVDDERIRRGLEGNLCRCTGYVNIVRAVQTAAREMAKNARGERPTVRAGNGMPVVAERGR